MGANYPSNYPQQHEPEISKNFMRPWAWKKQRMTIIVLDLGFWARVGLLVSMKTRWAMQKTLVAWGIYIYMDIYGGCSKFFLLETAILSQKKITLAKLSPFPQKTFAGSYVGLYLGIFVRKQKLDKGNLPVWATMKTHSVAAAHSRLAFCLYRWSLLTFSGQFWHSHTQTQGSPASCLSGNKT